MNSLKEGIGTGLNVEVGNCRGTKVGEADGFVVTSFNGEGLGLRVG